MQSTRKPVTLITGASAGIGEALARVFAEHGHDLVLVARRKERLAAVADSIAAEGRNRPQVLSIDLEQPDGTSRLAEELLARGLKPAIVVNNAGFGLLGAAANLDRTQQLAMIDLNVRVLTDLSLRFIDGMPEHGGGIINMSSIAGFLPGPGMAVYFACKAYVLSFSQALHRELRPRGIHVTVVCPGPVPTEFHKRGGIAGDLLPRKLMRSASRVAREAYVGFVNGRCLIVPGFDNQVLVALTRFLPRSRLLDLAASYLHKAGRAESDIGRIPADQASPPTKLS
jgi:short-subunit dehydrogenase